jgi:hypothetical protein
MKKKTLLLLLWFIALTLYGKGTQAQSLIIQLNDGSEQTEALNTLQSLTFSTEDLFVNFLSGPMDTYALLEIRKLYFHSIIGIENNNLSSDTHLSVYPNPGSSVITLTGIPADAATVTVYGINGTPVLHQKISGEKAMIDISTLKPGLYLILAMDRTVKFIKQ